jgi:hypothetical protein
MKYMTIKLIAPDQTVLVPSDCTFLEVLEPGVLDEPDRCFNEASCPHVVFSTVDLQHIDIELRPRRIFCQPFQSYGGRFKYYGNAEVERDSRDDHTYSETTELTPIGKFTIKRSGMSLTYLVLAENYKSLGGIGIGTNLSLVHGDSSAGVVDGALPRALT